MNSACGDILPACLKYQRTEYAKKIRKDYEAGNIKERRCNMREYTLRTDGLCNTITTVQKDCYICVRRNDALVVEKRENNQVKEMIHVI